MTCSILAWYSNVTKESLPQKYWTFLGGTFQKVFIISTLTFSRVETIRRKSCECKTQAIGWAILEDVLFDTKIISQVILCTYFWCLCSFRRVLFEHGPKGDSHSLNSYSKRGEDWICTAFFYAILLFNPDILLKFFFLVIKIEGFCYSISIWCWYYCLLD